MVDLSEIEKLASESGNNFHCKVINGIKQKGWHTLVSPYYMDSGTDKPREIDITAERLWNRADFFDGIRSKIYSRLFIECKYITNSTVFWFSSKDKNSATKWLTTNTPLRAGNQSIEQHHYHKEPKVAKLFTTEKSKNGENEIIFKALNQCLNALVYLRNSDSSNIDLASDGSISAYINMPIIICNSFEKFFAVDIDTQGKPTPIMDNFQIEVNYAYLNNSGKRENSYFLVDVVAFDLLDKFFEVIEQDIKAMFEIQ